MKPLLVKGFIGLPVFLAGSGIPFLTIAPGTYGGASGLEEAFQIFLFSNIYE